MEMNLVLRTIKDVKANKGAGKYVSLTKTRNLGKGITKINTGMVVRLGVDYTNMEGTPDKSSGLPWGDWVKGQEGYLIFNESKKAKEEREARGDTTPKYEFYLRVATTGNKKHRGKVRYIDEEGNELTREEVEKIVAPSVLKSTDTKVMNINLHDVVELKQITHKRKRRKSVKSKK